MELDTEKIFSKHKIVEYDLEWLLHCREKQVEKNARNADQIMVVRRRHLSKLFKKKN